MTEPLRMTDTDVLALGQHMAQCSQCQRQQPCAEREALIRPLAQRLADQIDEQVFQAALKLYQR